MANQGCPNEGSDTRLFGRWGCWVQSRLSFHSTTAPKEWRVRHALSLRFPPYVGVCIPLTARMARVFGRPNDGRSWFFTVRAGFRWDPHWRYRDGSGRTGGYIFPEVIIKVLDRAVL